MENNQNHSVNQSSINLTDFLKEYNLLLSYISTNNLIEAMEEAHRITLTNAQNTSTVALAKLNNILIKVFEGNVKYLNTFNTFMQNMNIIYPNQATVNSQINARLKKIRNLYIDTIMGINNLVVDPFNIISIACSVQQNSPIINTILVRNDGEYFSSSLNFNTMMNVINQFTGALDHKLKSGNNAVDLQFVNNYIEITQNLIKSLEDFKKINNLKY